MKTIHRQKKTARRKAIPPKKVLATFAANDGNMKATASALGIDRTTLWRMQQANPDLAAAMNDILQGDVDEVIIAVKRSAKGIPKMEWILVPDGKGGKEEVYLQIGWIEKPDMRAAQLYLAAHARDRGYGKTEIDLGASEGTQLLITNTVVRRGEVKTNDGRAEIIHG